MKDSPYYTLAKKQYPKIKGIKYTENEVLGPAWKAWRDSNGAFISFDGGHFVFKIVTLEISDEDFLSIRDKKTCYLEIVRSKISHSE